MSRRYPRHKGWIRPVRKGFRFACCDCHLVHVMQFRVIKGRAEFLVERDNRATSAMRRHRPILARKTVAAQRIAQRNARK